MIKVAFNNIEMKIEINDLLFDPLILILVRQGCFFSMLLHNIVAKVLANLINADERIKGTQIGHYEIKIVNLVDDTTIFVERDITSLNRIQMILKLCENAKMN